MRSRAWGGLGLVPACMWAVYSVQAPEAALSGGCLLGAVRTQVAEALGLGDAGSRELRCLERGPLEGALQSGIITVGKALAKLAS